MKVCNKRGQNNIMETKTTLVTNLNNSKIKSACNTSSIILVIANKFDRI